jgi:WD40 repeat protein
MNNECFLSCCNVPGVGSFALSLSGMLCSVNAATLTLDRWVNLQSKAYCLEVHKKQLFVGVESGAVHQFDASTLQHVYSFPPAEGHGAALSVRVVGTSLHVFFADKTHVVSDLVSHTVGETFAAHTGMIMACEAPRSALASTGLVPEGGFATCSADNTIRVWNSAGRMISSLRADVVDAELLRVPLSSASPGMRKFAVGVWFFCFVFSHFSVFYFGL